ncbi:alpha/beta hydrolase [Arenimonas alkanexedens]
MTGHVIISHGLESGPDASKASALGRVARELGWTHERPDYLDLDKLGPLGDVEGRIRRLAARAHLCTRKPLVLAGSSMGAFISARVSRELPVAGLFLMAPPIELDVAPHQLQAAMVPTRIVHGWEDELIPALDVVRWAQRRQDTLVLVPDSHRLAAHVEFCAEEFGRFLQVLAS